MKQRETKTTARLCRVLRLMAANKGRAWLAEEVYREIEVHDSLETLRNRLREMEREGILQGRPRSHWGKPGNPPREFSLASPSQWGGL